MGDFFKTIFGAFAGPLFLFVGLGVMVYTLNLLNVDIRPILAVIFALTPVWLPLVLFYVMFEQWKQYTQAKFVYENGRTTLRIKLPQEVFKSPEAMESVLTQIFSPNPPDNLQQTYIDGKHALVNSLEIVSIGGEVRFYANVPTKKIKNTLEAQLYAQYPGIEITEEKIDYTSEIVWDPKKWDMISFHLTKKGDDVYPIKTYIDYGMDKLPKEELKFEPMSPLIEHLGKAKPTERLWVQILMKPHAKQNFKSGSLQPTDTWEKKAMAEVDKIMGREKGRAVLEETDSRPVLTMSERDTIAAIERNSSKCAYETAIRAMYIAESGKFDGEMISPMLRSFAQYEIIGRNGIGVRWRTDFDYNFFSDYSGARKLAMKKRELEEYKKRYYYRSDAKGFADTPKIMSVEEIATIFHIPGTAIVTPTLGRVESNRKEAPANLPTGL